MRDLVLVFADLSPVESLDRRPVSDGGVWRFGAAQAVTGGWRAMLARGVGRPELAWLEPASLVSAGLRGPKSGEPWLATPMHWQAGLTTVHIAGDARLRLDDLEAAQWCAAFAEEFGAQGLSLHPAGTAGFLLEGLEIGAAETVEPARLGSLPLAEAQPRGPGSARLRSLMSEIEMWLHGAAPNRARQARAERPMSALWLWGGGAPPREPPVVSASSPRWQGLFGEETRWRALVQLSSNRITPECEMDALLAAPADSGCAVIESDGDDVERLTMSHVSIALEAIVDGRLDRVTFVAQDRAVQAQRADRWRRWRPSRRWTHALGLEIA